MTIRRAEFVDIPRLAALLGEMHARSLYRDRAGIDLAEAKRLMTQCVQRHGGSGAGGTRVMVAVRDDRVEGFIVGMLAPLYEVLDRLMATDLFFYCSRSADPRDAMRLLIDFRDWAQSRPKVVEIRMGATDAINGGWSGAEKLYRRLGLSQTGVIYGKRIDR